MATTRSITIFQGTKQEVKLAHGEKKLTKNEWDAIRKFLVFDGKSIGKVFPAENKIQVLDYVGVLGNGHIQLEVLPKVFSVDVVQNRDEESIFAMQCLVRWMEWTDNWPIQSSGLQDTSGTKAHLFDFLIQTFAEELAKELKKGAFTSYTSQQETQQMIRGRVLFSETLRQHIGRTDLFEVERNLLSRDNPLNQVFVLAIRRALDICGNPALKKQLLYLLNLLEGVSSPKLSRRLLEKVHFSRLNQRFKPVFEMAGLLLKGQIPGLIKGNSRTFSFVSRTQNIFEIVVEKALQAELPQHIVVAQHTSNIAQDKSWGVIKPDLLVKNKSGRVLAVIDAKYKVASREDLKHPERNDRFQLIAYAALLNCRNIFFVYPQPYFADAQKPLVQTVQINGFGKPIQATALQTSVTGASLDEVAVDLAPIVETVLSQAINP